MEGFNRKDWIKILSKHRSTSFDLDEFSGKLILDNDDVELLLAEPLTEKEPWCIKIPGAHRLLKLAREIINFCEAHNKKEK